MIKIIFPASCKMYLLVCLLLCVGSCKESHKDGKTTLDNQHLKTDIPKANDQNDLWLAAVNSQSETLQNLYTPDALKIMEDGSLVEGNKQIAHHYHYTNSRIEATRTDTVILANGDRKIEYEMGGYHTTNGKKFKHIVIWQRANGDRKRTFEYIAQVTSTSYDLSDIDSRRQQWIELCNKHDASALIQEMYSDSTLYYNHKPIVKGREALAKEYSYMNNEKYELSLHPIIVDSVNEEIVIEIGQCKGSYNGKYIIIWKKNQNNKWEVFIDSNI